MKIIISTIEGRGKELLFNEHPTVPLYIVIADTNAPYYNCKSKLIGKYSKLEEATDAYNNIRN